MLRVRELTAFYGTSQALFGMELAIDAGEVVTLMGRNGMGKTTTVSTIMGLLPSRSGAIELDGRRIDRLPSFRVARLGLGLVPEGRHIFPNLSVRENLIAAAANRSNRASPSRWLSSRSGTSSSPPSVFSASPELASGAATNRSINIQATSITPKKHTASECQLTQGRKCSVVSQLKRSKRPPTHAMGGAKEKRPVRGAFFSVGTTAWFT